jgi:hypothetical protein
MSIKRGSIVTAVILIAAALIGVIFIMSDNAYAGAASSAVIARPGIDASGLAIRPGIAAARPNVFARPNVRPNFFFRPNVVVRQPFFFQRFNPFIFDEEALFFGEEGFVGEEGFAAD